jgi:nucleotide-binding universal stress UspA family protein
MKRFKNILFISDNHERGQEAFERAAELALRNEAKLTVIGVVKVSTLEALIGHKTVSLGDLQQRLINERSAQIEEAIAALTYRARLCWVVGLSRLFRRYCAMIMTW